MNTYRRLAGSIRAWLATRPPLSYWVTLTFQCWIIFALAGRHSLVSLLVVVSWVILSTSYLLPWGAGQVEAGPPDTTPSGEGREDPRRRIVEGLGL